MRASNISTFRHEIAVRYGLAVLAAMAALFLRELLSPFLGSDNPYHTVWAAVVFSAWYYGVGPAVVTTLLGGTGSCQLPIHSVCKTRAQSFLEWQDFSFFPDCSFS
jgi:hypothetical protein